MDEREMTEFTDRLRTMAIRSRRDDGTLPRMAEELVAAADEIERLHKMLSAGPHLKAKEKTE